MSKFIAPILTVMMVLYFVRSWRPGAKAADNFICAPRSNKISFNASCLTRTFELKRWPGMLMMVDNQRRDRMIRCWAAHQYITVWFTEQVHTRSNIATLSGPACCLKRNTCENSPLDTLFESAVSLNLDPGNISGDGVLRPLHMHTTLSPVPHHPL